MAVTQKQRQSDSIVAGRARRGEAGVRFESNLDNVLKTVNLSMEKRVRFATEFLLTTITKNINVGVTRLTGPRGGKVVIRSKPGEFPRAETTQLKKTLIKDVRQTRPGLWEGFIGTPLNYGLILESKRLDRSFLVRTLNEQRAMITRILTGPIR